MIEIQCICFGDLGAEIDPNKIDDQAILLLQARALKIAYQCNRRQFGEDCPPNCPIPRIATSNLDDIRKAIKQASKF